MKHFKLTLLLLTAFLSVALVSTLSAQSHRGMAGMPRGHHEMMAKGLDLTDEQQSKMADLRLALQKELLPFQTELQSKMADLRLLKTENSPNLNRIDQVIEQAEKIRTDIQKARARHQVEVRKMLTAEQQKLWDSRTLREPGHRMGKKSMGDEAPF